MADLLGHLLARGMSGTASASELKVIEYLAEPNVNRRVFGQPLSGVLGYTLREYLCIVRASDKFATMAETTDESVGDGHS